LNHFRDLKQQNIAVIGDRLLTDVVLANQAGLFSILLTEPLTIQGDNISAIIIRFLEKGLLKILKIK
jgi:predicted HAD superfamily phosphohydrolase YqeG